MGASLIFSPGIAGIDEAGRGPLAGPVVAAAVILPKRFNCKGINDSKQLEPEVREELAMRIRAKAMWSVAWIEHHEIDRINILQATFRAMKFALMGLAAFPESAQVDGNHIPPGLPCKCEAVIGGDGIHANIAAASIIAKTTRDGIMRRYGGKYPEYGFERHFGYSTPEHFAAIEKHGPCAIHRLSFSPFYSDGQQCLMLDGLE